LIHLDSAIRNSHVVGHCKFWVGSSSLVGWKQPLIETDQSTSETRPMWINGNRFAATDGSHAVMTSFDELENALDVPRLPMRPAWVERPWARPWA
jgi:hypothetical protein